MILSGKHIFIIEDNPANASIMATTLQTNGATTSFDRWGKDTIERLKKLGKVDLILMDLMLAHNLSGYEVFDQLKAEPRVSHIPVVIVSASDATTEMNKARDKGFAGYIAKPINYITFPSTISRIMEGEAVWIDDAAF